MLGSDAEWARPGLRVIQLGRARAVTIAKAAHRNFVFVRAAIVFDSETRKDRSVPEGNKSLLYISILMIR